jgi:hypothetical protein
VHHFRCCLQVKETDSFHLARVSKREDDGVEDILVLLPTVEGTGAGGGGGSSGGTVRGHMRTLGYMGSFLLQYTSAQVRACAATAASLPV